MSYFDPNEDGKDLPLSELEANTLLIFAIVIGVVIYQANHTAWLPYIF